MPSRFQIIILSVKCSFSCRKILGKKTPKIYASHKHGNCSSCSGTEKIGWLEFRRSFVGSAFCGLTLDGCDAVISGGSVCEEVMSVLYIAL